MMRYQESITCVVQRVTFHNERNGWSVLKVKSFNDVELKTVTVHQTRVFAGATMEFKGAWVDHKQYGRQFQAVEAIEKKPASTAAIEQYIGSGLIKGVGPKTAKKIVNYFKEETLDVFDHSIHRLTEVEGIAKVKLAKIEEAWRTHCGMRDVMMFLQQHGISSHFAVRIYKEYKDESIEKIIEDPYRLSNDFYGIGFFSADKVALSIGLALDSPQRIMAAIKHVLAASREHGHCYLMEAQIVTGVDELLEGSFAPKVSLLLQQMEQEHQLKVRLLSVPEEKEGSGSVPTATANIVSCYYSKTLYYDEVTVAEKLNAFRGQVSVDQNRVNDWIERYCQAHQVHLSDEQLAAVQQMVSQPFSVLTGGPGCGKTTTILVLVKLLEAMKRRVILVAPTGRASQRMSEVIGREAKTIHRLLEWKGGRFQKCEDQPLQADFVIVDECSMLDISLSAALLKAIPPRCQLLFIGDADQLPAVGAGNVLSDIITSNQLPVFRLTKVFRQAQHSLIIQYAHQINRGDIPRIDSPFHKPRVWEQGADALFIDSAEMTQEQIKFVAKVKRLFQNADEASVSPDTVDEHGYTFQTDTAITSYAQSTFAVPDKFKHVDLNQVMQVESDAQQLKALMKKVHPWSSLQYGLSATQTIVRLYKEWIPKYRPDGGEIQILSPMTRGSLGTSNLNKLIQQEINPETAEKAQMLIGERLFREGDRVIHRKNNYDLNVFNGDIGKIVAIDHTHVTCTVAFAPDDRLVEYAKDQLIELDLAYAITIHKSQGSEFGTVIIPILNQHFKMLYRNLIYTGLTRAKKMAVMVGSRQAFAMSIRQQDTSQRQTALPQLLSEAVSMPTSKSPA